MSKGLFISQLLLSKLDITNHTVARDRTSCSQLQKWTDFHPKTASFRWQEKKRQVTVLLVLSFLMLLFSSCGEFTGICVRLLLLSNYFHVQPRCRDCCVQSGFLLACFPALPLCNQTQTKSKIVSGKNMKHIVNYRGRTILLLTGF